MTSAELLARFDRVRRAGTGWLARCPSHEDRNPSLSIREEHGKTLIFCHAGCTLESVTEAAGLRVGDLFADAKPNGNRDSKREVCARYVYRDAEGNPIGRVCRTVPKGFYQEKPDGRGEWVPGGFPPTLYNLPDVTKAQSILVVEGERDVETARKLGLTATCNPMGAGKWRPEYSEFFRRKRVGIIADADAPGLAHSKDEARSLVGVAESVRLIEALPESKDLSEFIEKGGTREALLKLIREAPELTPTDIAKWAQPKPSGGFNLTSLGDLMREPEEQVSWLLEGILPAGGLSLSAAKPKTGKSTKARCLALAVSRGEPFLGRETQKGAVIYLALEEKRSEVRAHFRAMGATGQEQIFIHAAHAPADALLAITEEVKRHHPVLLIVDPLLRFTRVRDGNDYAQVTAALEPLLVLARENNVHVLLVHHLGKGERAEATDGILGSTALFAAVDTALVMKRSEKYRTIQSRQRYGEDLPETVLLFDPERRTLSLGVERSEADVATVSEEILRFLDVTAGGKTEPEITEAVEGKTRIVRQALRDLVKSGKVERDGGGKRGDPYTYSKSLFSCSQYIAGTREQETQKPPDTRMDTEQKLVPDESRKSFLVPREKEGQF